MATTTNYGWTTPDDTALVKDGASAIRTLGSSVDTTTKNLNPETTLGDLAYRSSTANVKTRLGLGTALQVLRVNSGATAPEWATLAAGGKSYSLLNAGGTSLSGSSTSITGISGQDDLVVIVTGASCTSTFRTIYVTFNSDTASNYLTAGGYIERANTYTPFGGAVTEVTLGRMGGSASDEVSAFLELSGGNSATGYKKFMSVSGMSNTDGARTYKQGGVYTSNSAITSVQIAANGTFDAGTVYIYASA